MGIAELSIILAIVVLLFGAKKLPELADGMGKALRSFKRGVSDEDDQDVTADSKHVAAEAPPSPEAKG